MIKRPALVAAVSFSILLLANTLPSQTTDAASPAGTSKVRIVRLSEVRGPVQLDRNTGRGFEPAMANLPIVEQNRLQTGEGVAEVEFEDNSTLRLAPDSVVEFPQLERLSTGNTVSSVHLLKGMAYVSLVKTQGNEFSLLFGEQRILLPPATHIRLQLSGTEARLSVLDGALRVDEPSGTLDVPHKKTVTFDLLNHNQPTVAKDILPEPFDSWDHDATGYHARTANLTGLNGSSYAYGQSDLSYYGSFTDAGGCGSMWRPYFASAAWDPYSNGAYAYYPGAGYSWVSPYPWGWTPYHYGSWSYCQGAGWGWQPGGTWNGLNNTMTMLRYGGAGTVPSAPVHPPKTGEPTMTVVNLKPIVRSEVGSADSFVFRKDSAGFGIPRGELGKLDKLSERAVSRGMATTPIYISAPAMASSSGRLANSGAGHAAVSIHSGYAPQRSSSPTFSSNNSASGANGNSNASSISSSSSNAHASSGSSHH